MGLLLISAGPASAARLLDVYIEQDGNLIAHTFYDDGGRADAATVWRYLAQPPIMVDDDVTNVPALADDPLSAELTGELTIRIQHSDRVIARTQLRSLMLRRKDPQTQAWFLPQGEVERTAFVAGLGPPNWPTGSEMLLDGYLVTIAACVLILVGCIIVTLLLLRGPSSARET